MRDPIRRNPRRAYTSFGGTLVRVDDPELIYLNTRGSAKIVAVAVPDGDGVFPFFGAEISDDQWSRYLREEVDLRYLILFPKYKRWYEFDLYDFGGGGDVPLSHISFDVHRHAHLVPEVAFFARSHTYQVLEDEIDQVTQSFSVDGAWNLSDFSNFYGKLSDVYSFYCGLKSWTNDNLPIEDRRRVRAAFEHPWRGGFSYVAFFEDLYVSQPANDRLAVHSIQYASPGHVDVDGKVDVFDNLKSSLSVYGKDPLENKKFYNEIHKSLSQGGYLKRDAKDVLRDDGEVELFKKWGFDLSARIGFGNFEEILRLSEGNSLVSLKIMLAVVRRVDGLFSYFAEGRAKIPGEDIVLAEPLGVDEVI